MATTTNVGTATTAAIIVITVIVSGHLILKMCVVVQLNYKLIPVECGLVIVHLASKHLFLGRFLPEAFSETPSVLDNGPPVE